MFGKGRRNLVHGLESGVCAALCSRRSNIADRLPSALFGEGYVHSTCRGRSLVAKCITRRLCAEPKSSGVPGCHYLHSPHFELLILILTPFPLVTYNSLPITGLQLHSVIFYFNFSGVCSLGNHIGHNIFQFIQQIYPELTKRPGVMLRYRHKNYSNLQYRNK